jgi:ferredoxin
MKDFCFKVDENKCIHCGLCEKDCICNVISLNENKIPVASDGRNCINCQHCLTICPVGAISVNGKSPENSDQIYSQNPDMILNLIKSRRSDRNFKNENLDNERMQKLKDMLKYVPTGCNCHGLHFSFIDDVNVMNDFRDYVNKKVVTALTKKPIKAVAEKFSPFAKGLINGEDVIFRGAPHMIVVSNSIKASCAAQDPIIALSYFELYAQSLGVGTCWCGLAEGAMKIFPELCDYMEIPEGYQLGYAMLFGEKEVNYQRTIQPQEAEIVSAKKKTIDRIGFCQKIKRFIWNFIR